MHCTSSVTGAAFAAKIMYGLPNYRTLAMHDPLMELTSCYLYSNFRK
jgi:hypothetical protein